MESDCKAFSRTEYVGLGEVYKAVNDWASV